MSAGGRTASIVARLTRRRAHIWLAIALVVGGAAAGLVANLLPWADGEIFPCIGVNVFPLPPPKGHDVIPILTYLSLSVLIALVAFGTRALFGPGPRWATAVAGLIIGAGYTILATHAVGNLDAWLAEISNCGEALVGKPVVASVQIVAGIAILLGAVIVGLDSGRAASGQRGR